MEGPRRFFPAQAASTVRDNGRTLRRQQPSPRAEATLPSLPPSAFAHAAFSGLGISLAVVDYRPDRRRHLRYRHVLRVLLRMFQGHAGAVAIVRTQRGPQRRVWTGQ